MYGCWQSWYEQVEAEEEISSPEPSPPSRSSPQSLERKEERKKKKPPSSKEKREPRESLAAPSTCLWVGNISGYATQQELTELFSEHGLLNCGHRLTTRCALAQYWGDTGDIDKCTFLKNKQCAFITMKSKEMAEAALRALNQKDFIDRRLSLHFAKESNEHKPVRHKSQPKEPRCDQ